MSQSQTLFSLQQIDTQIDQTHSRIEELGRILSGNTQLQQCELDHAQAEQHFNTEIRSLQGAEQLVLEQQIKIEQTEAALYGGKIHVPKELQDLQNELASLKRHLVVLEERQFDCMVKVEEAQAKVDATSKLVDEIKASWIEKTANLQHEVTQLELQIDRLAAERAAALTSVVAEILPTYEQLRKQRKGVAVAKISAKSCGACGATLTPAILQAAQSSSTIIRCPTCSRILYSG